MVHPSIHPSIGARGEKKDPINWGARRKKRPHQLGRAEKKKTPSIGARGEKKDPINWGARRKKKDPTYPQVVDMILLIERNF
jgi:hypothetical protein